MCGNIKTPLTIWCLLMSTPVPVEKSVVGWWWNQHISNTWTDFMMWNMLRSFWIHWYIEQGSISDDEIQTQNLRTPSYTAYAVDESERSLTIHWMEKFLRCYSDDDQTNTFVLLICLMQWGKLFGDLNWRKYSWIHVLRRIRSDDLNELYMLDYGDDKHHQWITTDFWADLYFRNTNSTINPWKTFLIPRKNYTSSTFLVTGLGF